jgi:hypothetical protein
VGPWSAAAAVAAGLITFAVTGWPVAGIAAAPAVVAVPRMLSRRPAKARLAKLEALESWTRRLADVLAASRALEEALIHSAQSPPAAIAAPVQALARRLQGRSTDTTTALRAFAAEIDDPVGDLIATALMLAAEVRGPGLHAVLTELAADVARDISGRREVEAARASYRSSLTGTVVLMAGFLAFLVLNRSYSAPFGTPGGQFVLAIVAASWAGALYWLRRLDQMTGPQRFLPSAAGARRRS